MEVDYTPASTPRGWTFVTRENGTAAFSRTDDGASAVLDYGPLLGTRRFVLTMCCIDRTPTVQEITKLKQELIPQAPTVEIDTSLFDVYPNTRCLIETDDEALANLIVAAAEAT